MEIQMETTQLASIEFMSAHPWLSVLIFGICILIWLIAWRLIVPGDWK